MSRSFFMTSKIRLYIRSSCSTRSRLLLSQSVDVIDERKSSLFGIFFFIILATQPTTKAEKANMCLDIVLYDLQAPPPDPKTLYKELMKLDLRTWYVFVHENLSMPEAKTLLEAVRKDGIKNYILFQRKNDAIIIHCCPILSHIKCRCHNYKELCPPMERRGRLNLNQLQSTNNIELFREMIQCLINTYDSKSPFTMEIKKNFIMGVNYSFDEVKAAYAILRKASPSGSLTRSFGLKLNEALKPHEYMRVSKVENLQMQNERIINQADFGDIIGGHVLSDKSVERLAAPRDEITTCLFVIMEKFMPIPTSNIFYFDGNLDIFVDAIVVAVDVLEDELFEVSSNISFVPLISGALEIRKMSKHRF